MRRHHSPEERSPCGVPGLTWCGASAPFDTRAPDLSDCLVSRPRPWWLVIWEPLPTKAPSPAVAQPYVCYACTVIFYARPYVERPWKKRWRDGSGRLRADSAGFEEFDRIETRLRWDDVVAFEGEAFVIGGGFVRRGTHSGTPRWWMCRTARRQEVRHAA